MGSVGTNVLIKINGCRIKITLSNLEESIKDIGTSLKTEKYIKDIGSSLITEKYIKDIGLIALNK